jgi:hypothetical protein
VFEVRLGRFVGHIDAVAVNVEFPAVVNATQAALFVATEEETRAAMRTVLIEKADLAVRVAESDQVFAKDAKSNGVRIGRWQLGRKQRRQPEAAKELAHGRTWPGATQKVVLCLTQHACLPVLGDSLPLRQASD